VNQVSGLKSQRGAKKKGSKKAILGSARENIQDKQIVIKKIQRAGSSSKSKIKNTDT
jgi:hypothetical protein